MWYIIGAVVLVIVIVVIVASSGSVSAKPSVPDSPSVAEEPKEEATNDDYDECRCGSPGGSCCWK